MLHTLQVLRTLIVLCHHVVLYFVRLALFFDSMRREARISTQQTLLKLKNHPAGRQQQV